MSRTDVISRLRLSSPMRNRRRFLFTTFTRLPPSEVLFSLEQAQRFCFQKRVEAEMLVGQTRHHAAARRAVEKTDLDEVRLDDFLDRVFFLVDRGRDRAEADRA